MSHASDLIASDIDAYLEQHRTKELLRFITCGSVDDGKSTLIGRLLHDSKLIYEDQLAAVTKDSEKHGTTGEQVDLALLVDGLKAEREQGITIDVAYRYFSTAKRKFIIADCPGHEQYTRNMVTGASTCDMAVILLDARKGVLTQTKRHSFIVSLLGIKHVIVAINKMDLVDYSQDAYEGIAADYREFATRLDLGDVRFLPMSALEGDNVVDPSERMEWYQGPTLMHLLENVHIASDRNLIDFRLPVQRVIRPDLHFRGYAGTLTSGVVRPGDQVLALPSGKTSRVDRVVAYDKDLGQAFAPQSVVLTLEDEIDISRGDMLVHPNNVPRQGNHFEAMVVWMTESPMLTGKEYLLKHTCRTVPAKVSTLRYGVEVNTLSRKQQSALELNQVGRCSITTSRPIFHDAYRQNRATGAFILVDRMDNNTVAAGMIIDRGDADHDHWDDEAAASLVGSESQVSMEERRDRFGQTPATLLLTGLTGAGKSTIARALERRLFNEGRAVAVVDGQNLRRSLSKDLTFSGTDRSENLRRFGAVASLLNRNGLLVVGAFAAPDEAVRQRLRDSSDIDNFLVVHLDCDLALCRERDKHDLYSRADQGEIDLPGVNSTYEAPVKPDLRLDTGTQSVADSVSAIVRLLEERGFIPG